MSAKNPKAGRGPCPSCGAPVLFRSSPASGRLTYSCDHCDHAGYADKGGAAHAKWLASLTDKPAAAKISPEISPVATARKPASTGFSLGGL